MKKQIIMQFNIYLLLFMEKIQKFISEFKFDTNIIFAWLPWRWKTHIMQELFKRLPKNEGALNKYWIDDWEFREKITACLMWLMPIDKKWLTLLSYPLEVCIRVKVLFFDDLWSSGNITDAQKTKLKYILDERYKKWLITIFSTNFTPKQVQDAYGERIKSRIYNWKHPKWLQLITIDGEDRRKENIKSIKF